MARLSLDDGKMVEKELMKGDVTFFGCLLVRKGLEQRP